MPHTALIIVDVQNDFLPPDGALAVPDGDKVIPVIQDLLGDNWSWDMVITSQDYHPSGHISFASSHSADTLSERELENSRGEIYTQTMWPEHCVVGTKGAEIDKTLRGSFGPWKDKMRIVRKGWHPKIEAYSAFEGYITAPTNPDDEPPKETPPAVAPRDTDLAKLLRSKGVGKVVVTGLATDYCVLSTARSAIEAGFETILLGAAVRGIKEDGVKKAFADLEGMGGVLVSEDDWEGPLQRALGNQ